jgi:hypothetical protein
VSGLFLFAWTCSMDDDQRKTKAAEISIRAFDYLVIIPIFIWENLFFSYRNLQLAYHYRLYSYVLCSRRQRLSLYQTEEMMTYVYDQNDTKIY